jgi:hypothetical protein
MFVKNCLLQTPLDATKIEDTSNRGKRSDYDTIEKLTSFNINTYKEGCRINEQIHCQIRKQLAEEWWMSHT